MVGDCGSWVIDAAEGFLVGHIVAEEPTEPVAYLVPAHIIAHDIELKVGARFSIAGPEGDDGASVSALGRISSNSALDSRSSHTGGQEGQNTPSTETAVSAVVSSAEQSGERDEYDVR